MSIVNIRRAIEKKMAGIASPISTAYENVSFTPVSGVPYQRLNMLHAAPSDITMGRKLTELSGIMQVTLLYPQNVGSKDAEEYAERVKAHFKPVQTLTEAGTEVQITDTANIATGYQDGDRYVIPISIPWFSYVTN